MHKFAEQRCEEKVFELNLPNTLSGGFTMQDLFDSHFTSEDNHCIQCKENGVNSIMIRKTDVVSAPSYLIVSVVRYKDGKKDKRSIRDVEVLKVGDDEYALVSSIVHIGNSVTSGHYYSLFPSKEPVYKMDYNGSTERLPSWVPVANDEYAKTKGRASVYMYIKLEKETEINTRYKNKI